MNTQEKLALDHLNTILNASQQVGQLPVARKLVSALNLSVKLGFWNKEQAKLKEAIERFAVHPLGPGVTAPEYLICECHTGTPADPKTHLCTDCGRKRKKI